MKLSCQVHAYMYQLKINSPFDKLVNFDMIFDYFKFDPLTTFFVLLLV